MTGILNLLLGAGGVIKDAYFNLVSLLLPGNGTNGAQNNTFLDGSSNNFTITRNGNTTQGTFSPFSQTGWGAYFAGSGARVSTTSGSQFAFGTGDFTVEFWMYPTSSSSNVGIFDTRTANNNGLIVRLGDGASNPNVVSAYVAGTELNTKAITYNSWQHVAIVRSSGNGVIYVNGVGSTSKAASGDCSQTGCLIAALYDALTSNYIGYLSNFRVVKGRAVYTSDFTPPTSNLGATSGGSSPPTGTQTSLLTLQSNRFVDNGGLATPNTLTITNSVSVTPFSPFAPTQSYSAAAVGGSGYFDGTGDYLSIASTSAALPTGTQDYSVEAWVYWGTQGASFPQIITNPATDGFQISYDVSGGTLSIGRYGVASVVSYTVAQSALANQWTHILATRSGNTHRLFVNGVLRGNAVNTISFAALTTQTIASAGAGNYFVGYISGIRTVLGSIPTTYQTSSTTNGTAIFDPPTAPPTTTSQGSSAPSLLLNFTNAGVVDATAKNVLETVGNAQISTTQSKWGGGSIRFDGTSNTSCMIAQGRWQPFFGANFSIEMWFRVDSISGVQTLISQDWRRGIDGPKFALFIGEASSDRLTYFANSGSISIIAGAGNAISANTWYFVQVIKSGSTTTMYLNGTSIGSAADTYTYPVSTYATYIGRSDPGGSVQGYLTGYIDDLRVTIGQARTAGTATAPFPLQ